MPLHSKQKLGSKVVVDLLILLVIPVAPSFPVQQCGCPSLPVGRQFYSPSRERTVH